MREPGAAPERQMGMKVARALSVLTLALAGLAACGDSDPPDSSSITVSSTLETARSTTAPALTTAAPTPTTNPQTTGSPSTAAPAITSTTVPPTTLPGDELDFGPRAGDVLAVVGVQHDDVLNVRHIPGLGGEIIETLPPDADDVVAEGRTRLLPNSIWFQVTVDGETGWASSSFLGYLGMTDDATAEILGLTGDVPVAETLTDLALTVADLVASHDPPSRIRITAAPTTGDLGEITVDVVGLGDDALLGWRLHVFATEHEAEMAWELRTVERTAICGRGVSDGLCV